VGKFQQQAIYSAAGITKQKAKVKVKAEIFAAGIKADSLYAAFASYRERGDRSYWLLRTKSEAEQAKGPIKVVLHGLTPAPTPRRHRSHAAPPPRRRRSHAAPPLLTRRDAAAAPPPLTCRAAAAHTPHRRRSRASPPPPRRRRSHTPPPLI
jgi:hypothetical protein